MCVKYQVINYVRSQAAFQKHGNFYKSFVKIIQEETFETVLYDDLEEALNKGVKNLPEKTQLVFRLNRMEGRSISEIAAKLNLSEKAIKYHITRSLKELRLHLRGFLFSCLYFMIIFEN